MCCFCKEIPCNVVESACCNSLFCWDCVVKGPKECPSCNRNLDPETCIESLAVKKIIDGISVRCKFDGCFERMTVAERPRHQETCPHGSVMCPNSELCGIMERSGLTAHLTRCQFRPIRCHLCEVPLILSALQAHLENACEETMVDCTNHCLAKMKRKDLRGHIGSDCPNAETDCPFALYGCATKLLRCNVDSHISDNIASHVGLMSTAFNAQQAQITQLREQVATLQQSRLNLPSDPIVYLSGLADRVKQSPIWASLWSQPPLIRILIGVFVLFFLVPMLFKCFFFGLLIVAPAVFVFRRLRNRNVNCRQRNCIANLFPNPNNNRHCH